MQAENADLSSPSVRLVVGSRKLSAINLTKFTTRIRTEFDALKAAGLSIDAFEIGNELDWICLTAMCRMAYAAQAEFMTAVRAYAIPEGGSYVDSFTAVLSNAKIITFEWRMERPMDKPAHHFNNLPA